MNLADEIEPLAYDVAFAVTALEDAPPADVGESTLETSRKLRALAVLLLLARADVDKFRVCLGESAALRRSFLERAGREAPRSRAFAAGRFEPLFDALAQSDPIVACDIAALSPTEWRPHAEYEDDFCYAATMHAMLLGARWKGEAPAALVRRFEKAAVGAPAARLDVVRALLARSSDDFVEAFDALLLERTALLDERAAAGEPEDPIVVAESRVYVEGLGLLFLADHLGLDTDEDYLYCPSIARRRLRP